MDSISFNSKILLFGEYGIMHDSNALSIPYKKFNGSLSKSNHLSEDQKISNRNIESLYEYIIQEDYLNNIINSDNLKEEIDNMYQGYWQTTVGVELKGKILGLIGLGRVGSQVANGRFHRRRSLRGRRPCQLFPTAAS